MIKNIIIVTSLITSTIILAHAQIRQFEVIKTKEGEDLVLVNVLADRNIPVVLSYYSIPPTSQSTSPQTSSVPMVRILGDTNEDGWFSRMISTTAYRIDPDYPVYVTVNGYFSATTTWPYKPLSNVPFSVSQENIESTLGSTMTVPIFGTGPFYILNKNDSNIISSSITGSDLIISPTSPGRTSLTICQSLTQCSSVAINVKVKTASQQLTQSTTSDVAFTSTSSQLTPPSQTSQPQAVTPTLATSSYDSQNQEPAQTVEVNFTQPWPALTATVNETTSTVLPKENLNYKFSKSLSFGSKGQEVSQLQKRLKYDGYFIGEPSGFFGPVTMSAVKKFQKEHELPTVGVVGPMTRSVLNNYNG